MSKIKKWEIQLVDWGEILKQNSLLGSYSTSKTLKSLREVTGNQGNRSDVGPEASVCFKEDFLCFLKEHEIREANF